MRNRLITAGTLFVLAVAVAVTWAAYRYTGPPSSGGTLGAAGSAETDAGTHMRACPRCLASPGSHMDCPEAQAISRATRDRAIRWARERGLSVNPKPEAMGASGEEP